MIIYLDLLRIAFTEYYQILCDLMIIDGIYLKTDAMFEYLGSDLIQYPHFSVNCDRCALVYESAQSTATRIITVVLGNPRYQSQ